METLSENGLISNGHTNMKGSGNGAVGNGGQFPGHPILQNDESSEATPLTATTPQPQPSHNLSRLHIVLLGIVVASGNDEVCHLLFPIHVLRMSMVEKIGCQNSEELDRLVLKY